MDKTHAVRKITCQARSWFKVLRYITYVPLQRTPSNPKAQSHKTPPPGLSRQVPPFRQGLSLQAMYPSKVGHNGIIEYIKTQTHISTQT